MPASLPAPVLPGFDCGPAGCTTGTSDDGAGNFALGYVNDNGPQTFPVWQTVQMKNGQPVLGGTFFGSTDGNLLFSEPVGFSHWASLGSGDNFVENYAPDGTKTGAVHFGGGGSFGMVAPDPNGGFAALVDAADPDNPGARMVSFSLYGKALEQGPTQKVFSGSPHFTLVSSGMTLGENTLAFLQFDDANGSAQSGIWIDKAGNASAPFHVASAGQLQFLLGGGVLERSGNAYTQSWNDGATAPSPLPAWLLARASGRLSPIREGAGYAMFGTCNGIEVLTTAGASCGCLAVPNLSASASIGRDGSLIVPNGRHYELYPLLFH